MYLETNGLHDEALPAILPFVDVIAMDVKLPSATGTPAWKRHGAFLSRAVAAEGTNGGGGRRVDLFVKVVVDDRSSLREIEAAAQLVASADPLIPFVIQPESGALMSSRTTPESLARLERVLASGLSAARAVLADVRVIPQVHKILDVR